MKYLIIVVLSLLFVNAFAQQKPTEFDAGKWQPPYKLVASKEWSIERFPIPIEFAPNIPFHGVEDLRFTPGWADAKSDEYWSYVFLWFLEGEQKIEANSFEQYLKEYYSGLVGRNIEPRKIPKEKLVPTTTKIMKTLTSSGDNETFTGTVSMLDYMGQKPMILNCIVHVKSCPGMNNTFVFFEISPQQSSHVVWQNMDQIWKDFSCGSD